MKYIKKTWRLLRQTNVVYLDLKAYYLGEPSLTEALIERVEEAEKVLR